MSEYTEIFNWIDAQASRMRQLVIDWANINSFSRHPSCLNVMCQRLKADWQSLGGRMTEIELAPEQTVDTSGNLFFQELGNAIGIRIRPDSERSVFLCIHMDTVYHGMEQPTVATQIDENTLKGPGVCDAKGGLAVMLIAAEAFERSPWAKNIGLEVLINPDEEIGSPGSSVLFEQAARRNDLGLLFEPTLPDGSLVSHRGGSGSYSAVIHGRSAHAGRDPHLGRNAIVAAAEMAMRLSQLTVDGITVNVGKIDGGGPVNVVPDLAICRLNVRARTAEDQVKIVRQIDEVVTEIGQKDGIRVEVHGGFHRPPKPLNDATRMMQGYIEECGHELGLATTWRYSGGVSDGNQLAAAGLPNIDSLGPRGGSIHSPDEFLLLDSLTERAKLSALFLMKFARGEFT